MINPLILANIFSLIGRTLFVLSSFPNTKKGILIFQIFDATFDSLACLVSGSYSGATTTLIAIFRNILAAKNINNKLITIIICMIMLITGTIFNDKGLIGFFPIIASITYTLIIMLTTNVTATRVGLILHLLLWLVHDIHFLLIPAIITDVLVVIINLIKIKKENQSSEDK